MTELELYAEGRGALDAAAGRPVALSADLLSGVARTAAVMGGPEARTLEEGDPVICDLVPGLAGYWGDSCLSWTLGPASPGYARMYAVARRALDHAARTLRPGLTAGGFAEGVLAVIEGSGLSDPIHVGHGIGVTSFEHPRLVPGAPEKLRPGMVLMGRARRVRRADRRRPAGVDVPRDRGRERGAEPLRRAGGAHSKPELTREGVAVRVAQVELANSPRLVGRGPDDVEALLECQGVGGVDVTRDRNPPCHPDAVRRVVAGELRAPLATRSLRAAAEEDVDVTRADRGKTGLRVGPRRPRRATPKARASPFLEPLDRRTNVGDVQDRRDAEHRGHGSLRLALAYPRVSRLRSTVAATAIASALAPETANASSVPPRAASHPASTPPAGPAPLNAKK